MAKVSSGTHSHPTERSSLDHSIDDRRVVGIEEPVAGLAIPIDANHQARAKLSGDLLERGEGEPAGASSFDPRDQRL